MLNKNETKLQFILRKLKENLEDAAKKEITTLDRLFELDMSNKPTIQLYLEIKQMEAFTGERAKKVFGLNYDGKFSQGLEDDHIFDVKNFAEDISKEYDEKLDDRLTLSILREIDKMANEEQQILVSELRYELKRMVQQGENVYDDLEELTPYHISLLMEEYKESAIDTPISAKYGANTNDYIKSNYEKLHTQGLEATRELSLNDEDISKEHKNERVKGIEKLISEGQHSAGSIEWTIERILNEYPEAKLKVTIIPNETTTWEVEHE